MRMTSHEQTTVRGLGGSTSRFVGTECFVREYQLQLAAATARKQDLGLAHSKLLPLQLLSHAEYVSGFGYRYHTALALRLKLVMPSRQYGLADGSYPRKLI